ncbi:hypothetical protein VTH06DRAFT_7272 [Thermothelomyces fergusii]
MSSSADSINILTTVVGGALALVGQLGTEVAKIAEQKRASTTNKQPTAGGTTLDGLALAHDSAALVKAHATKISLLIINEPFTPTAITKVVRELVSGPVPSLAAAVEVCAPARYTYTIQQDLAWRAGRVLTGLKELLSRIPQDGKILTAAKKNAPAGAPGGRGSIATTGVLWSACDDVMTFAKRGFAGVLTYKVEQLNDTLKDVMEELREWGEQTEDGDESDDDQEVGINGGVSQVASQLESSSLSETRDAQDILDDLMNSQRHIPRDDPDKIRERLDSCLRRLRLTTLLYQAVVKRRLKPLPRVPPAAFSDVPARLDEVMAVLKRMPERFGSLAMAFYELDRADIDRLMDECFFDAFAASELLAKPWNSQKDEFTDWALRFQVEIKKG